MLEIPNKKQQKNVEKIFLNHAKPHGRSVLGIYIVDVLIAARSVSEHPITVFTIQQAILKRRGYYYCIHAINVCLNNIHLYSHSMQLETTHVRRGKNKRVKAFTLKFKTADNEFCETNGDGAKAD